MIKVLYNRHGVAAFGEEKDGSYSLYWANPQEKELKKVDCSECKLDNANETIDNCNGTMSAKAAGATVDFQYNWVKVIQTLNGERASEIDLDDCV